MKDKLLTPAEVADQLRVNRRTVLRILDEDPLGLPCSRIGHRTIRIRQSDVDAYLDRSR